MTDSLVRESDRRGFLTVSIADIEVGWLWAGSGFFLRPNASNHHIAG